FVIPCFVYLNICYTPVQGAVEQPNKDEVGGLHDVSDVKIKEPDEKVSLLKKLRNQSLEWHGALVLLIDAGRLHGSVWAGPSEFIERSKENQPRLSSRLSLVSSNDFQTRAQGLCYRRPTTVVVGPVTFRLLSVKMKPLSMERKAYECRNVRQAQFRERPMKAEYPTKRLAMVTVLDTSSPPHPLDDDELTHSLMRLPGASTSKVGIADDSALPPPPRLRGGPPSTAWADDVPILPPREEHPQTSEIATTATWLTSYLTSAYSTARTWVTRATQSGDVEPLEGRDGIQTTSTDRDDDLRRLVEYCINLGIDL
ncbi:hypothetical protein FOZ62_031029, partial [Perkinsus olseni]